LCGSGQFFPSTEPTRPDPSNKLSFYFKDLTRRSGVARNSH
jgi:hypothetical protein